MERIDDLNIENLRLIQNTDYFLFGIDSVVLANSVVCKKNEVMLDLCCGTGVIPMLVGAKQKGQNYIGVEVQKEMYDLAVRNIQLNKLEKTLHILNCDIKDIKKIRKYLMDEFHIDSVDCITCNPPYKKIGTGIETKCSVKNIARNELLCTLDDVFITASNLLKSRGRLYIVHKPERITDLLCIARKYNLEAKKIRFMQPSITKKPSIVVIEFVKDGGNECIVENVLLQYDELGNHCPEILSMYKEGKNEE